ncbi:unnamed protein product [Closterium sp. Naga37s-1]|nr:unnamed protein product [Closterium sp. Naga37s-1]
MGAAKVGSSNSVDKPGDDAPADSGDTGYYQSWQLDDLVAALPALPAATSHDSDSDSSLAKAAPPPIAPQSPGRLATLTRIFSNRRGADPLGAPSRRLSDDGGAAAPRSGSAESRGSAWSSGRIMPSLAGGGGGGRGGKSNASDRGSAVPPNLPRSPRGGEQWDGGGRVLPKKSSSGDESVIVVRRATTVGHNPHSRQQQQQQQQQRQQQEEQIPQRASHRRCRSWGGGGQQARQQEMEWQFQLSQFEIEADTTTINSTINPQPVSRRRSATQKARQQQTTEEEEENAAGADVSREAEESEAVEAEGSWDVGMMEGEAPVALVGSFREMANPRLAVDSTTSSNSRGARSEGMRALEAEAAAVALSERGNEGEAPVALVGSFREMAISHGEGSTMRALEEAAAAVAVTAAAETEAAIEAEESAEAAAWNRNRSPSLRLPSSQPLDPEPSDDHQATTESPTSQQSSPGAAGNGVKQQRADRRVQFNRMVQVRRVLVPSDSTDSAGSFAERIQEACAGPAAEARNDFGDAGAGGVVARADASITADMVKSKWVDMTPMTAAAAAAAANTVNSADCGAAAAAAAGANAADAASPDAASLVPQDLANPRATDSEQEQEEIKMIVVIEEKHAAGGHAERGHAEGEQAGFRWKAASKEETTDSQYEESESDLISPSGLPFLSVSPRPSFGPAASALSPTTSLPHGASLPRDASLPLTLPHSSILSPTASLPANTSLPPTLPHSSTLPSTASHSPRNFSSGPLSSLSRTLSRDMTAESTQKHPRRFSSGPLFSSLSRTLSRDVSVESTQKAPSKFSSGPLISSLTRTLSRSRFKHLLSPLLSSPSKPGTEARENTAVSTQEPPPHDRGTDFGVASDAGSGLPKQVPRSASAVDDGEVNSKARQNWLKVLRVPRAGVLGGGSKG